MLETAEDDIEEIPHLPGLPSVIHRDGPGEKFLQNLDLCCMSIGNGVIEAISTRRRNDGRKEVCVHGEEQSELRD